MIKSGMKLRRVKNVYCWDENGECVFLKNKFCYKRRWLSGKGFEKFRCGRDRFELMEDNNEQSESEKAYAKSAGGTE